MLGSQQVNAYLCELASSSGTPGGGAAAAVTGAQAAALMSMVCNLTRDGSAGLMAAGNRAESARDQFIALAELDVVGFDAVMAAWKLPRAQREQQLPGALMQACEAPLEMMREAAALIDHLVIINREGNRNLITDTAIAACLLESTLVCARLNVLINTSAMNNPDAVESIHTEVAALLLHANRLSQIRQQIETGLLPQPT